MMRILFVLLLLAGCADTGTAPVVVPSQPVTPPVISRMKLAPVIFHDTNNGVELDSAKYINLLGNFTEIIRYISDQKAVITFLQETQRAP